MGIPAELEARKVSSPIVKSDDLILDRAKGAVCGGAAGDALGAGYEFTNPHPEDEIVMKGGGAFNWAPGEWTDDTAMAVAILDALAKGHCDIEEIGENFLSWYASSPPDVGIQTSAVLSSAKNGAELILAGHEFYIDNPNRAGNGALMRTGPVALSALGDREAVAENATAIAALTHAHPDSTTACVLWSLAIEEAIMSTETHEVFDWERAVKNGLNLVDSASVSRWEELIDEAIQGPSVLFNPNGYVVSAFQAALSAITETPVPDNNPSEHFSNALETAVRIGDDCDTVAAIAGSLLGARWGSDAIPNNWKSIIHGRREQISESINYEALMMLTEKALL
jgi:ADP-ribosyl-[dinitrogen reductase] hydrolase